MELQIIQSKIYELRSQRVMIDFDLAQMYNTETKVLKQAVKRNINRFPQDFMFELTKEEYNSLRSQIVTLENGKGKHSKYLPFAFTEQGVAMLSSVLKSDTSIEMNISIMRAFVAIRQYLIESTNTSREIEQMKQQIKLICEDVESLNRDIEDHDQHFDDIYQALTQLASKQKQTDKPRNPIGFR